MVIDRHLFSGDALGTQCYSGGTSFVASTLDSWTTSMSHLSDMVGLGTDNCKIDDIFNAHLGSSVPKEYITWMATIVNALKEKKDVIVNVPGAMKGSSLVVMKDGQFMDATSAIEVNKNGCYTSDLHRYCSITYMADK